MEPFIVGTVDGVPVVGVPLSARTGTWTGSPTPTFTYQWNADGSPISGATDSDFLPTENEEGAEITVTVTATNTVGSVDATSEATDPVLANPATVFIAAMSSKPDEGLTTKLYRLGGLLRIGAASGADLTGKLDVLYLRGLPAAADARLNFISRSYDSTVGGGAPVHNTSDDYQFDGVDDWLNSNFNPSTAGGHYTTNSACFGVWSDTSGQISASVAGFLSESTGVAILPRWTDDKCYFCMNSASAGNIAGVLDGSGLWVMNRIGSDADEVYHNGVKQILSLGGAFPSAPLQNGNFRIGGTTAASFAAWRSKAEFWGASLTEVEQADIYFALAEFYGVSAAAFRMWSGALTDSSITVGFDTTLPASTRVRVAAAADTSFNTVIASSPLADTSPDSFPYYGKHAVSGLSPDTEYRYAVEVDGVLDTAGAKTFKTAPAEGVAAAFSFAFGSCSDLPLPSTKSEVFTALAGEDILFLAHLGDMDYSDYTLSSIAGKRLMYTRKFFRDNADVAALLAVCPIFHLPDNHDGSGVTGNWNQSYNGVLHQDIMANTRQVYQETVPHYPLVDDAVLMQVFDIAKCRFIGMDTRSQRYFSPNPGTPTCLGNGTRPPGSFDQFTAVCNAISQAAADGVKMLFLLSPETWSAQSWIFQCWKETFPDEQTALCNFIDGLTSPPKIVILSPNAHLLGADDGTNANAATTPGGFKVVHFCASPFHQVPLTEFGPFEWNRNDGKTTGNDRVYAIVAVSADNEDVVVTFKGRNGPGSLSTIATYDTADLAGW